MAKDFAKKTKKRSSASRFNKNNQKKSIPGWIWLVAGLLLGILASSLLYIEMKPTEIVVPPTKKKDTVPSAKSRYQAVPAEKAADSDFSYHDVLENKEVEVSNDNAESSNIKRPERSYIMQCGSFKKESLAETLKAQIAMNGFQANIKGAIEKSGTKWYRVTLGPYTSKRKAERERHQLERNNINNCKIW